MINNYNLTPQQQEKLKAGIDLIYVACELLQEVEQENENELDLFELSDASDQISEKAYRIAKAFEPVKEYQDFLQADIVKYLAEDLDQMTEFDEVQMTLKHIKNVIDGVPDRKHIENVINWSIREKERKEFRKYALTENFRNAFDIRS